MQQKSKRVVMENFSFSKCKNIKSLNSTKQNKPSVKTTGYFF